VADQGKWFKLWCSSLEDQALENMELDEWARWARFGTYIKRHGHAGEIEVNAPCRALQNLFRLNSYYEVLSSILKMPNIIIATAPVAWPHGRYRPPTCEGEILKGYWYTDGRGGESQKVAVDTPLIAAVDAPTNVAVDTPHTPAVEMRYMRRCLFVSFLNWSKYQEDSSVERTRQWRKSVTLREEKRSRREVEEKRDPPTPFSPSASPARSTAQANGTARGGGLKPAGTILGTLKINGKPYQDPPEGEPMSAEEMARIKAENFKLKRHTPAPEPAPGNGVT
jgi:hypothetical protein